MARLPDSVTIEITLDTSKFEAAMKLAARSMARYGDAIERTAILLADDYALTGVPPYGGRWSRRQMRPR